MRNRVGREFREIKEIKEFKEYREEVIYSANTLAIFPKFLKFLKILIFPNHQPPNFSSEGVRLTFISGRHDFMSEWCRCGITNFHQR
jgi:hypothetical protein